ncbi:M1 family metallopeptidase [Sphingomicrobium nitratireducens]|uniref:M1 family metallopeptidase n=1 Tax=Sphingomicrobium nitratireducens TaxID=2964666 RepID=UPI002240E1CC|nr:M1 family metallopeptidase [Sphingomicrobium nitratireducens]
MAKAGRSDWVPWAILAIVALVLVGLVLANRPPAPLAEGTAATGRPLTAEQQSVAFRAADLTIEVFPDDKAIEGRMVMALRIDKPIERIQFDLDERLAISVIEADGARITDFTRTDGQVGVPLPRRYEAGEALSLRIDYSGKPHVAARAPWDGGFVWSQTPDGAPWIATAVQGEGCDLFWPCFDNSLVEIGTLALHVIVPEGLVAPANGRFMGKEELPGGRVQWNWQTREPNNYAVALNIAPYEELSGSYESRYGNTIPLHFWYLPGNKKGAEALFSTWPEIVDFFEETVGPYPFGDEKLAAVETPHLGMEHQTINAYGQKFVPIPEGFDWLFQHELAHEWFGNQLTNEDWDDMWLHEGFGAYMQPAFLKWRDGEAAYQSAMWKQRQTIMNRFPVVSGEHRLEDEVYNPEMGPGQDIYVKGSWVLHTLRGLIGEDAFWTATRRLVYGRPDPVPGNFRPRFGTTNEFVEIVSEEAGRDMGWFFDAYLRKAQLPRLASERQGGDLLLLWQTPDDIPFPMPVEISVNGERRTVEMGPGWNRVGLPSPEARVILDPDARVLKFSDAIHAYQTHLATQGGHP